MSPLLAVSEQRQVSHGSNEITSLSPFARDIDLVPDAALARIVKHNQSLSAKDGGFRVPIVSGSSCIKYEDLRVQPLEMVTREIETAPKARGVCHKKRGRPID
ncbi:hypothetical protein Aspvir_008432 [Aspergillus viridinutans]|uniref:Uncharacterized protein n=1 Tax=Aspergillus viridinutans TaxID=75553 RepID=A0A9P3C307_ASPVI|nr:uncharacterized protein Aspvir_008432 [Aspergillus viridinutans]GIK04351.1 hypothetical protein Aspvir_008432 [Aspergillus viridinutans]